MSEDKIEIDVEQAAEAFTDELSDEALDRLEGAFCVIPMSSVRQFLNCHPPTRRSIAGRGPTALRASATVVPVCR